MWYCWKHKPKSTLTVDQLWSALKNNGLAFIPHLLPKNDTTNTTTTTNSSDDSDNTFTLNLGLNLNLNLNDIGSEDVKISREIGVMNKMNKSTLENTVYHDIDTGLGLRMGIEKCQEGIFPLTYLRGIDGMLIAIANSSERAYELFERTRDMLEELEKDIK